MTISEHKLVVLLLASVWLGCSSSSSDQENAAETPSLSNVSDWAYQLQDIVVDDIANSTYDLVVIDYSADGSDDTAFSSEEVTRMKGSGNTAKLVIAYMSIGEAEDYRYYFNANASYMDVENPDWPGNFKVHYWESEWQAVIDSYVDRLIRAGCDGAYLDIIDGYEYFEPGGDSQLNRTSAASDMVNFVQHIADYARAQDADFLIFPQNGSALLDASGLESEYLAAINGIGAEDTFYFGEEDENNERNEQAEIIANLNRFVANGKVVLSVDYLTDTTKIDDFYTRATAQGYLPHATVRDLDQLTINTDHEPR